MKERVAEEDKHDEAEPSTQTAALIAPIPPVAVAPVQGTEPIAPVAAEASPAEVEESKAKAEDEKASKPEERRRSKFLKKPLALDLRKRVKDDQQPPPATAPLERREPVECPTPQTAMAKERSQSFSGRRESDSPPLEDEPRSGTSKIKNWFSSHFSRPRTKSTASAPGAGEKSTSPDTTAAGEGRGFIGGAALRRRTDSSGSSSASSLRDVALASVSQDNTRNEQGLPSSTAPVERETSPARSVSSLSGTSEEREGADSFQEAREDVVRSITPPPAPRDPASFSRLSVSPVRGSRFSEVLD